MIPAPIALGLAAAGGYALLYLRGGPGRSVQSLVREGAAMFTGSLELTAAQEAMAARIVVAFRAAGLGHLGYAAVANAYAESRLDPTAINSAEDSVGLFQLRAPNGLGAGMTAVERQDPGRNIDVVIDEARRLGAADLEGRTHRYLVRWFAQFVERCWECGHGGGSGQLDAREQILERLYGPGVLDAIP